MNQQPTTTTALTTCKACGNTFTGKYCNQCGEKVYTDHDKSILHFFEEGFHFITHFEGTLFTTLGYIFTSPGKLSEQYCAGIRKSLFKPVSLFFLLMVIYLLFPVFEGLNQRLYYHTHNILYGNWALEKARLIAQQHNWTDLQLSETFHKKSAKVSKLLILVLLPLTALFFWLFTYKRRPYFFDQMVFATEINSVYIIWNYMIMPLIATVIILIVRAITGHGLSIGDEYLRPAGTVLLLYVVIAAKRFYSLNWAQSIGLALLFYIAHIIIVQLIYKFLLFLITINMLH